LGEAQMRRTEGQQVGFWAVVLSVGVAGCVAGTDAGGREGAGADPGVVKLTAALAAAFPGSKSDIVPGGLARIYGQSLSSGATPSEAAERFRQSYSAAVGAGPNDLVPEDAQPGAAPSGAAAPAAAGAGAATAGGAAQGIGLMYDQRT